MVAGYFDPEKEIFNVFSISTHAIFVFKLIASVIIDWMTMKFRNEFWVIIFKLLRQINYAEDILILLEHVIYELFSV